MTENEHTTAFAPAPYRHLAAAFVAARGKMAVFKIEKNGQCLAVGVKVFPFRTLPMLAAHALTPDTTVQELCDAHLLLKQATTLGHYHWDTPSYRETCAALGLDADVRRPSFRPSFRTLAEELLRGAAVRFGDGSQDWLSLGFTTRVVLDLLDLMRADLRFKPVKLSHLREKWCHVDMTRLPQPEELTRLVQSDELLQASIEKHLDLR